MQHLTKRRKREQKKLLDEIEDLREEKRKLEELRDSQLVFDACLFYIGQPHLTQNQIEDLRVALATLSRSDQ